MKSCDLQNLERVERELTVLKMKIAGSLHYIAELADESEQMNRDAAIAHLQAISRLVKEVRKTIGE